MITEQIYHHEVKISGLRYIWSEEQVHPFQELMVSFNAERPAQGHYEISVSVNGSEWLPYAYWSSSEQRSYAQRLDDIELHQDILSTETPVTNFKILVEAKDGAILSNFFALHAATQNAFDLSEPFAQKSVLLPVKGLSQLDLDPQYAKRICAATSTTAVMRSLTSTTITPISFALGAYDSAFDVFGNWVFNVARAHEILGPSWRCWVQRLEKFNDVLEQLYKGIPVVVSIKGQLPGAHLPYNNGHLIAIIGYEAEEKMVICMDPAYPKDSETIVRYPIKAFLEAWAARKGLAFIFTKKPKT